MFSIYMYYKPKDRVRSCVLRQAEPGSALRSVFIFCSICRQVTCACSVHLAVLCARDIYTATVRDRSIGDILVPYLPCTAIHGGPSLLYLSQPQNSGLTPKAPDDSACILSHIIYRYRRALPGDIGARHCYTCQYWDSARFSLEVQIIDLHFPLSKTVLKKYTLLLKV